MPKRGGPANQGVKGREKGGVYGFDTVGCSIGGKVGLVADIHIEVYTGGRRGITATVPFARVVVIMVIIVFFVAARQCKGGYADEEGYAEDVFYRMFHDDVFVFANRKTLPDRKRRVNGGFCGWRGAICRKNSTKVVFVGGTPGCIFVNRC
jgi:hypothetical protein